MKSLDNMNVEELQLQWLKTFNRPAPMRAAWFLKGNLEYHQRCQKGQGLSPATVAKLKAIAAGKTETATMKTGTKLFREWQGEAHEVEVLADGGYQYRGQRFKSLSAIARHITGTPWSGNAFFGLKKAQANG